MVFGDRFRELRNKKKLTQEQLAAELNVAKRTIINYEAGRSYPTKDILDRIEKFFNARIDFLMDDQDEFISQAQEQGGHRGKRGAEQLVTEVSAMFAGGELTEIDKDEIMQALQSAYWDAKNENKKYTPKKYRK